MALDDYRVIDYPEKTSVDNTDFVMTDSESNGTNKYQVSRIVTEAEAKVAAAVAAETAAREAADDALQDDIDTRATSTELAAETAAREQDVASLKADFSQLPTDGVVASSKQLLSENGTDNTEPYLLRVVPVNADRAELNAVIGVSVPWNQLTKNGNFESNNEWTTRHANLSVNNNVASFTPESSGTARGIVQTNNANPVQSDHKYLISAEINPSDSLSFSLSFGGASSKNTPALPANTWTRVDALWTYSNPSFNCNVAVYSMGTMTTEQSAQVRNVNSFNLTQMFGSTIADYIYSLEQANAGAGVAWFKKLFPKEYYEYNAGELVSVSALQSHDMIGFNQWDEEWENGRFNITTGAASTGNGLRNKNMIRVFPNTVYHAVFGNYSSGVVVLLYYDANGGFLSYELKYSVDFNFTTPDFACYLNFNLQTSSEVTAYYNDICINLSLSGWRNGEYEAYDKHSYPLDSSLTLRGIPKVDSAGNLYYDGDIYSPDGTVTRRYGVVDLGTLTWTLSADGYYVLQTAIPDIKPPANGSTKANAIAENYLVVTANGVSGGTEQGIGIGPNGYAYASDMGSTPSGYLIYELATPTTETATPYQSLQVCDPNGTEEFATTGIVPVGHETRYPENLRAKIEGLPWDFSNLIAPTESGTASRNYTVGSLLIMDNVLYKVTANIANGGTITPGTNCTATTLSEVILALQ